MTIDELKEKHLEIFENKGIGSPDQKHSNLSIQFAIELLKNFYYTSIMDYETYSDMNGKEDFAEELLEGIEEKINELEKLKA